MSEALHRILILCRKELLAILKDPRSRIVLFGPIILQTLLFGYAATFDLNEVPYAVLDDDRSGASHDLLAQFEGSGVFHKVAQLQSTADFARVIDRKQALLILHIGQDFERQLEAGRGAALQVVIDGRNSNTAGTAAGYVRAMVEAFNARWRAAQGARGSPVNVQTRAWYNQNLETRWQMIPSLIAALSMLQTMMLTALSVAREREQGTFDQLLVTPLRPSEIMAGKAIPPIMIGLAQSSLILLIALFWFRIPFVGSAFTLYFALLLFTIASVGIGLAISAYSANMQQAMLYAFVLLMPMMLLSGLTSSIENMPEAMQIATYANPLRYAIEFVHRIYLEGAGVTLIINDLWPLALIAAITLPFAAWLFRHRLV
ncbi:MAG: ABC transporter permease [Steroidobacter sp.]